MTDPAPELMPPTTPTQTAYPGRASVRTGATVGRPAFIGLVLLLPTIIQELVSGPLGGYLPRGSSRG